jgi:hypothetical protein
MNTSHVFFGLPGSRVHPARNAWMQPAAGASMERAAPP